MKNNQQFNKYELTFLDDCKKIIIEDDDENIDDDDAIFQFYYKNE